MMARGKRRFAGIALLVFAVWPLVQYSLTQRYQVDPWKFAGWAMYTVPKFEPRIEAFLLKNDRLEPVALGSTDFAAVGEALEEMVYETSYWGELADFDSLAREIRRAAGPESPIEIVVSRYFVDPNTAVLTANRQSYFYPRGEPLLH